MWNVPAACGLRSYERIKSAVVVGGGIAGFLGTFVAEINVPIERRTRMGDRVEVAARFRTWLCGTRGSRWPHRFLRRSACSGHSDAIKHMVANLTAVALEAVYLLLRLGNPDLIRAAGIYMSGIVVLILIYSGWKGAHSSSSWRGGA